MKIIDKINEYYWSHSDQTGNNYKFSSSFTEIEMQEILEKFGLKFIDPEEDTP